ncbi:hypothetical protein P20652_3548 [Pseudoalteromonas sp. BSi20652]|nr:hypothetical protein P20652_3548 [Pseudoalteromonas sp. BSi20652]
MTHSFLVLRTHNIHKLVVGAAKPITIKIRLAKKIKITNWRLSRMPLRFAFAIAPKEPPHG